ncbi:MAG: hypothetical protein M3Z54_12755 [Gemmatimonadota bacterium]|nr:hypothetical protein [Gemmatimonadota bacterium]
MLAIGLRAASLGSRDKLVTSLVFLYWLVYENVIFFYAQDYGGTPLFLFTNGIKLFLPFLLLVLTGLPSSRMFREWPVGVYLVFFVAFLLWGAVPTLVSGDPLAWFKLLPRFVFFLSLVAFFSKRPSAFLLFAKCVIVYVISALVQYVLVYLTGAYDNRLATANGFMAGPHGLLGNLTSMMWFPGFPIPILRLCGFWNEPSHASASAFAAFFLARYVGVITGSGFWKKTSYAAFLAGILALSNAGYFALGSALLVGALFGGGRLTANRAFRLSFIVPIAGGLLWIVIFGRSYVSANLAGNVWARAITGVRDLDLQASDPSGGRIDVMHMTVDKAEETFIGVGLQEVGSDGITGSGAAPLLWLLLTGFPGLLLILCREATLVHSGVSLLRRAPVTMPLVQALTVVMAQHLSYGSWMNPNYFIHAAMVLVCCRRVAREPVPSGELRNERSVDRLDEAFSIS